jgi:hypothetical protein
MGLRDPRHRKKSWSQTERLRAEAYFDDEHALHVHKDKVRFYLNLDPVDSASVAEKQLRDLVDRVSGRP